jgi:hypothetical protein
MAGILEHLVVEKPHEQTPTVARGVGYHFLKRSTQAVTEVEAAGSTVLVYRRPVVRAADF